MTITEKVIVIQRELIVLSTLKKQPKLNQQTQFLKKQKQKITKTETGNSPVSQLLSR